MVIANSLLLHIWTEYVERHILLTSCWFITSASSRFYYSRTRLKLSPLWSIALCICKMQVAFLDIKSSRQPATLFVLIHDYVANKRRFCFQWHCLSKSFVVVIIILTAVCRACVLVGLLWKEQSLNYQSLYCSLRVAYCTNAEPVWGSHDPQNKGDFPIRCRLNSFNEFLTVANSYGLAYSAWLESFRSISVTQYESI